MKLPKMPDPADATRLVMGVSGIGLTGFGSWLIYPPAGFIVVGVLLLAIAVVGEMRAGR
ncbi:MAG TPA: hypothetical protein VHZ78_08620 [Rhizomicrobium sp.]|jgi:hypothetical protein|nr:hypothetical protein [Rhizomicrobium sp.]